MEQNGIPQDQKLISDRLCERKVISSILNRQGTYHEISEFLNEDCFNDGKCRAIWAAIVSLAVKGEPIDIITVNAELSSSGVVIELTDLLDISYEGYSYDVESYALRLKELSLRRRLWYLGQKLISSGVSETDDIEQVQQMASEELGGLFDKPNGTFTLTDALLKLSEIILANMSQGSKITGTPTGFRKLDEKGGLHQSDLIIVAGETSAGKTSLALTITKNAIEKGSKIAVYSLEMTKEQLAARLLSMETGIAANTIMYSSEMDRNELEIIDKAKGKLPGDNLYFDDKSTSNIESILLSIRNLKMKFDIDGVIVDYLQILNVNQRNSSSTREQAMGDAARRLKNIAKDLGIWIIALSQLSRNNQDPEPTLSRLRDSGQIGEAADVVILIYRPEVYHRTFPHPFENIAEEEIPGKALIDVAKGRNIGIFKFLTNFNANTTHFTDIESDEAEYDYEEHNFEVDDAPF